METKRSASGEGQPMEPLSQMAVVIPALNEEASLPRVLNDLPRVGLVVVVDNGSTDRTAEVARMAGATVIRESQRGYGAACLAGIEFLERRVAEGQPAFHWIGFVDADYSDFPEQLSELAAPVVSGQADLVIGSRLLGERERGALLPQAVFGNWLACSLMRLLWGARFTDLGPFRVIRRSSLLALGMVDRDFGWTIEMQIKAVKRGLRIEELPVRYRRRIGQSKISGTVLGSARAGMKILWTIFAYAWSTRGWQANDSPERPAGNQETAG